MSESSTTARMQTVGLDVSDRYVHWCRLDAAGRVVGRDRVGTSRSTLEPWLREQPRARMILEVGAHSPWLSRLVVHCGHDVLVANARKLRFIYENAAKQDRVDAESLARVGRLDPQLLAPVQHRRVTAQADLAAVRARDALVRTRTLLINHVRGAVKALEGLRLPASSAAAFARRNAPRIPGGLQPALEPVVQTLGELTRHIDEAEAELRTIAARYPATERLQQVPGVGLITALTFVLTIDDPTRFRTGRLVGAYLGLCPRRDDSGERRAQLGITKTGDRFLRSLLVNAAHYIMGPFGPASDLRRWGLALAARGGTNAKKRAVIAVARKLAALLHRLWTTGEVYRPVREPSPVSA
jgi:transposase